MCEFTVFFLFFLVKFYMIVNQKCVRLDRTYFTDLQTSPWPLGNFNVNFSLFKTKKQATDQSIRKVIFLQPYTRCLQMFNVHLKQHFNNTSQTLI